MIAGNIKFLRTMIQDRRDIYGILSFVSDSIDARRTNLVDEGSGSDAIYEILDRMVQSMEELDQELDRK